MSRVGNKIINVPEGVKVEIAAETLQKIVLARASSLRFQNEICVSDVLKRLYQEQLQVQKGL